MKEQCQSACRLENSNPIDGIEIFKCVVENLFVRLAEFAGVQTDPEIPFGFVLNAELHKNLPFGENIAICAFCHGILAVV